MILSDLEGYPEGRVALSDEQMTDLKQDVSGDILWINANKLGDKVGLYKGRLFFVE